MSGRIGRTPRGIDPFESRPNRLLRRIATALAEITDHWARSVTADDTGEWLAEMESCVEVWEVRDGRLIDRRLYAPVTFLDEYSQARHRHPAGKRRT